MKLVDPHIGTKDEGPWGFERKPQAVDESMLGLVGELSIQEIRKLTFSGPLMPLVRSGVSW
jgi:hypothetical protein